ncbi:MAG: prohead protease/major capsid protein fusion protein, partial [Burkholderiaceae bacterium]
NYMPNQQNATSEFKTGGRAALEVISDAEITSATQWYLAADANQMDTVEYAYVSGNAAPRIQTFESADVDGITVRAIHDFATKAVQFRGLVRADGV